jgi:hypothetical protein
MKKIYILLLMHFCVVVDSLSQIQANVYTPKGQTVTAYTDPSEWDAYWRGYYDNYYTNAYPNATLILTYDGYSTTKKMNCHGYAWHYTETTG